MPASRARRVFAGAFMLAAVWGVCARGHDGVDPSSVPVPLGPSYRPALNQIDARNGRPSDEQEPFVTRSRGHGLRVIRELRDGKKRVAMALVRAEKDKAAALTLLRRHFPGWSELPWKEEQRVETVDAYIARLKREAKSGYWVLDIPAMRRQALSDLAGVTAAVYDYDVPDARTTAWMKLRGEVREHITAGRHQLALEASRKALASLPDGLEADGRREVNYTDIAAAHHMLREFKQSQRHYELALGMLKKTFPTDNERYADTYRNLAVSHESQRDFAKAESYYRRCLAVLDAAVPPQHERVARYADDFADLLRGTGRPEDAEVFAAVARRRRALAGTP